MSVLTKKQMKNAYRITKVRGKTALRVRVPGGHIETKWFSLIHEIAEKYGNGTAHITTRQGFEIPGIDFEKIPEDAKETALNYLEASVAILSISNIDEILLNSIFNKCFHRLESTNVYLFI